jgi:hypothetical protein
MTVVSAGHVIDEIENARRRAANTEGFYALAS